MGKPKNAEDRPEFHTGQAILAEMLRNPQAVAEVLGVLDLDDWPATWQRDIFAAMRALFDQGMMVDPASVAEWMNSQGTLNGKATYVALADLWMEFHSATGVMHHCKRLKDHSVRRHLERAGDLIADTAARPTGSTQDALAEAENIIRGVSAIGTENHVVSMSQAVGEAYDRIDGAACQMLGIPTGFQEADELTGGFQASELVVIGARPSIGKTAIALNFLIEAALRQNKAVFFASLEQSRMELAIRLLTGISHIDSQLVRQRRLGEWEMARLREAGEELRQATVFFDDHSTQTMFRIAATARRLKGLGKLDLVIVDYLQLVEADNRREARHEQVSQIAKRLKALARELNLPVVSLAQLNRSTEDGARPRRPRLSDLRESGGIEAAADTVWLLHRQDDQEEKDVQAIEVSVAKQRNGPIGNFILHYHKRFTTFASPDVFPQERSLYGTT